MQKKAATITISAAVIAAGVIGAGSAYAATSLTAKPTNLYGCIVGSNRTLEQVRTSAANVTKCKTGTPVTVNTDAVSPPPSYVDVSAGSNGSTSVTVTCPASHPHAVGGGVTGSWTEQIRVTISNVSDYISVSVPPVSAPGMDGRSWTASVNANASTGRGSLIVYAVCAN